MSFIDYLINNAVPFDKQALPDDNENVAVTVSAFGDEPGGGKTRFALSKIVSGGPKVYWWAINKIEPIASERHSELMALAKEAGVTVDFMPIHSKASGRGTMKMRIDKRAQEINDHPQKDETIFVTLITHKTLIDHYLRNVAGVLLIDEPAEIWDQRHFNFKASYRTFREKVDPLEVGDDYDADVKPIISADTQAVRFILTNEGKRELDDEFKKHDTIFSSYRWILDQADKTSGRVFALASDWNSLEDPDGNGDINILSILHPKHIAHFDECWMMAAYFKELMIYKMWSDLYDVEWVFHPIEGGWKRLVPLRDRVTIYYVLENRQVTDTYLTNKGNPKRRKAMAKAVAEFYGDDPFIWSVNKSHRETGDYGCLPNEVIGADGVNHPAYLTPKANGINCYQNLHGAAWLGSVKLPDSMLEILGRVWTHEEARELVIREYEFYSCLQFLARANSRRFDSYAEVRYTVADWVQAQYIADRWDLPKARVLPLPMSEAIKTDLDDVKSRGTGRKRTMTDDERRDAHRRACTKSNAKVDKAADAARKRKARAAKKAKA